MNVMDMNCNVAKKSCRNKRIDRLPQSTFYRLVLVCSTRVLNLEMTEKKEEARNTTLPSLLRSASVVTFLLKCLSGYGTGYRLGSYAVFGFYAEV